MWSSRNENSGYSAGIYNYHEQMLACENLQKNRKGHEEFACGSILVSFVDLLPQGQGIVFALI